MGKPLTKEEMEQKRKELEKLGIYRVIDAQNQRYRHIIEDSNKEEYVENEEIDENLENEENDKKESFNEAEELLNQKHIQKDKYLEILDKIEENSSGKEKTSMDKIDWKRVRNI